MSDFFYKLTKILHLIEGLLSMLVYLSYGHKLCNDFKSTHSMCHIDQKLRFPELVWRGIGFDAFPNLDSSQTHCSHHYVAKLLKRREIWQEAAEGTFTKEMVFLVSHQVQLLTNYEGDGFPCFWEVVMLVIP